jgi:hypothetical protein
MSATAKTEISVPISDLNIYQQNTLIAAIKIAKAQLEASIAERRQGKRNDENEILLHKSLHNLDLLNAIDQKQSIEAIPVATLEILYEYLFYLDKSSLFLMRIISKLIHDRKS